MPKLNIERHTIMIYLRDIESSDLNEIISIANNEIISKEMISLPYPFRKKDAEQILDSNKETTFYKVIVERDTDSITGLACLRDLDNVHHQIELSIWINPKWWNKGYATHTCIQLTGFAFNQLDVNRIYAHTTTENKASINLLKRIGFKQEGVLRERVLLEGIYKDVFLFSVLRREWEA